ncbi:hypothetical protein S40293_10342 [Stachybotrys chartarum IBT 40293]|nr:hypothetical protein S40293_10342 [Stachybotrys chartarum IBT 40293]
MSHIGSIVDRQRLFYSDALSEQVIAETTSDPNRLFKVHQETRQVLDENRDRIAKLIGWLQERLQSLPSDGQPDAEGQKVQLVEDIKALEYSLEMCKIVSGEVKRQKTHSFGEVSEEDQSNQVVVTTWADLLNVTKAISKGNATQLFGSMTGEQLIQLSRDRYRSRFGAVNSSQVDVTPLPTRKNDKRTAVRLALQSNSQ